MRLSRRKFGIMFVSIAAAMLVTACAPERLSYVSPPARPLVAEPAGLYVVLASGAVPIRKDSVYFNRLWKTVDSAVRSDRTAAGRGWHGGMLVDEPMRSPRFAETRLSGTASKRAQVVLWYPDRTDVYVAGDRSWSQRVDGRPFEAAMDAFGWPAQRRYDGTRYQVKQISLSTEFDWDGSTPAAAPRMEFLLVNRSAPGSDPFRLFEGVSTRRVDVGVWGAQRDLDMLLRRIERELR